MPRLVMAAAASETGAVPRTAIQAVHDMLFELRALRAYAGTARISEEAHALSLHSATRLGLYSIGRPSAQDRHPSRESLLHALDSIYAASPKDS